jgi:brefeldin A-resistance guanine nucleotide exchange factor 1
VNASRDIRQRAIGYLARILSSPQLLSSDELALSAIFDRVMFPVFEELLKPQIYNRDPPGMEEARLRASTMLCKTFLQYIMRVDKTKDAIPQLFLKVLDLLERFMLNSRRDQLVSGARRFPSACSFRN